LGASPREIITKIVIPGSLPQVFTGIRIAWGIALIVIIASEMIGATEGLGYMVLEAQQTFRVERVFSGIVLIGVIGFATDQALRAPEAQFASVVSGGPGVVVTFYSMAC
jgi:taurine transport system permease protein